MQTDNQVKPDARTECDSTGSSPARCSAAASKIKHVFRLELTRKQAKQLREEWAAHAEDGGMMLMQAGLNFGPFEVKNVAAHCAILTKDGATAVNNAIKPEKQQNIAGQPRPANVKSL